MNQYEEGFDMRRSRLWLCALGVLIIGLAGCSQAPPSQQILGKWEEIKKDAHGVVYKKATAFTDNKSLRTMEFFKDGSMMYDTYYGKWVLLDDGRLKLEFALPGGRCW